jgi:hypothetical protein
MTQSSEDRLPEEAASSAPRSAQILPFERPRSELQKAVQARAQEALDLDRDRTRAARKISPLRALVIFAIAAVPVYLMFSAVDGFVRALHRVNAMLEEKSPPPAPSVPQQAPQSSEPGVVILVNPDVSATAPAPPTGSRKLPTGEAAPAETSR